MALEQLTTSRCAGQSRRAFGAALQYSADGKFLFQREAHVVRVLHAKNGLVLHECVRAERAPLADASRDAQDDDGAQAATPARHAVSALALHPYNALQLIASYADGKILVWDFSEEKILQEFDAKAPILWMQSSAAAPLMLLLVRAGASAINTDGDAAATTTTTLAKSPSKSASKRKSGAGSESSATEAETDATPEAAAAADAPVTHWSLIEFNMKKKRRGRTLLEQTKAPFVAAAMQSHVADSNDTTSSSTSVDHASPSFRGDYVVVAAASRLFALQVQRDHDGGAGMGRAVAVQKLHHVRDVTCLALHPHALEFSAGDALGQIARFISGGMAHAKMHWHAHAVACLAYSSDGQFLLSGGEEHVLVSWHLESGRRAYLPRRSAPLVTIATRPDAGSAVGYAVALRDNALFQYNPVTREQEWQSVGLARSGESAALALPWKTLVFDPVTHAVPLNGVSSAGVLQFYEPYRDRVLTSVQLTERNQVTRTEDEELPQIVADAVAFSPRGAELVTLHRPTSSVSGGDEQALRFWRRRENGSFFVHTAIDAPHGRARVTALAYSPSAFSDCVVSGDERGEFKVWKKTTVVAAASASAPTTGPQQPHQHQQHQHQHQHQITNEVSTTVWHCQSVVQFRERAISALAFARDGSLVAVAYGHLLTIWDLGTMALRGVLPSADGARIESVLFTGSTSPFVVVQTATQVQVWNLLTMTLWWRYVVPEHGSFLGPAKPERDEFLVAIRVPESGELVALRFTPDSAVPVQIQRVPALPESADVWSVSVHPKTGDLILVDAAANVWRMGEQRLDAQQQRALRRASASALSADEDAMTPLAAMFKQARRELQSQQQAQQSKASASTSSDATAALFDAPAHVLPSMTSLYRSFMDKMLAKPQANAAMTSGEDDEGKKGRKKNSKKRKKQQQQTQQDDAERTAAGTADERAALQAKRVKAMVEKELASSQPAQAYAQLRAAFRKSKAKA